MGIQVIELTQGKDCHEKEFIDFEFDGKHISEFGMVAVFDGDRHSFDATPAFEDEISQTNGVDGQYYWGTHFGSKKITFSLATDGMTEVQINAFKNHFKPGKYGKFIEDKLSSRYGYARVSQVTTFNTIPFRIQKNITIGEDTHTIFINEYKGDCRITFEFDDPYMKTTMNLIENFTEDKELKLRAMYNNGTPYSKSWDKDCTCFVGDSTKVLNKEGIDFWSKEKEKVQELTYYNPATSKTKSIIQIEFEPTFSADGTSDVLFPIYFHEIRDNINSEKNPYNSIFTTLSVGKDTPDNSRNYLNEFRYTSPNVIQQINQTIKLIYDFSNKNSIGSALELEELLRLQIVNSKVIAWATAILRIIKTKKEFYNINTGNFILNKLSTDCSSINVSLGDQELFWYQYFNICMLHMLASYKTSEDKESSGTWTFNPYTITFNGEENRTYMTYSYNRIINELEEISVEEENCGDMILSEYLVLDGGDILDENGIITSCHHMKFMKGNSYIHYVKLVSLTYIPTYF